MRVKKAQAGVKNSEVRRSGSSCHSTLPGSAGASFYLQVCPRELFYKA